MANKVKFGLRNVHVFPITEADDSKTTYGEVIKINGGVSLTLDAQGEESKFYADDMAYYSTFANNGYSGELELALVPDEFKVNILGYEKDKNGAIFENITAQGKAFALVFEFQGDKNASRHLYYNVVASRPSDEHETIAENKTPKTEKLKITCVPRSDTGDIKVKLEKGQTGYNEMLTTVYTKEPALEM